MIWSQPRRLVVPLYLFFCLTLGGSTQTIWFTAFLQLGAVVLIGWAAIEGPLGPATPQAKGLRLLLGAMLLLVVIQLVPLPPLIWTHLPGRGWVVEGLALLNLTPGWQTLSLAPYDTIPTVLPLLPPLAILAAMTILRAFSRTGIAVSLFLGAVCSLSLGLLQIASAGDAAHHFYIQPEHNEGTPSGFFANPDHLATLLLVNVPFLTAFATTGLMSRDRQQSKKFGKVFFGFAGLSLVCLGLAINGSLAGLGLLIPVVALSLLIAFPRSSLWRRLIVGLSVIWFTGFLLVVATPLNRHLLNQGKVTSLTTRSEFFATGLKVARDYFPLGSGLGTFARVYRMKEDARLIVPGVYVNHAHNDYLEILIETGLLGIVLVLMFLFWWARTVKGLARKGRGDPYPLAAAIASGAILAHSFVDFPLRTSAISACMAASLGLLVAVCENKANSDDIRPTRHVEID